MIIDADAHYTPHPEIFQKDPAIAEWAKQYHDRKSQSYSMVQQRNQELPELGIDRQLLNPMGISLGIDYLIEPRIAVRVAKHYNDHMQLVCHDTKYDYNLWLPMQDLNSACEELQRHNPHSYFAIFLSDCPQWGFINNMYPIFAHAQQHHIPMYLHQTHMEDVLPIDEEFFDLSSQLNNLFLPQDFWQRTLASLLCSNLFQRYPELRFVVAERDIHWIPNFLDTLMHAGLGDYTKNMRENFWYTIEPEMPHFLEMAQWLGHDRLLFATDWPHDRDMGGEFTSRCRTVRALAIDESAQELIFSNNYNFLRSKS